MADAAKLSELLSPDRVIDLKSTDKRSCLKELVAAASAHPAVKDADAFLEAILDREEVMTTGVGEGIAIPHAKVAAVAEPLLVLGRSKKGIDFDAPDDKPARLIVLIGAGPKQTSEYLQILSRLIGVLIDDDTKKAILSAPSGDAVLKILRKAE